MPEATPINLDFSTPLDEKSYEELIQEAAQSRLFCEASIGVIAELEAKIEELQRHIFGRKTERRGGVAEAPGQEAIFGVPVEHDTADEEAMAEAAGADFLAWPKSERLDQPADGDVAADDGTDSDAEQMTDDRPRDKRGRSRGKGGRKPVSAEIRQIDVILGVDENQLIGPDGEKLDILRYEKCERLHYLPAQIVNATIHRAVIGRKVTGSPMDRAEIPPSIIAKGKCTDGLLLEVIARKFYQGQPLNRIMDELNCSGANVSKSLLSDLIRQAEPFFAPIVEAMYTAIRSVPIVHVDETPMPFQEYDETIGKVVRRQGYYVVFVADRNVVVRFARSRAAKYIDKFFSAGNGPAAHRQGEIDGVGDTDPPEPDPPDVDPDDDDGKSTRPWIGYFFMADGYAGYNHVNDLTGLLRLSCWTHARRYFLTPARHDPCAKRVLDMISQLYRVERQAKRHAEKHKLRSQDRDAHYLRLRQEQSIPILERLKAYLAELWAIYGKDANSRMAKAIAYVQNRWTELTLYVQHGFLPIDNNAAERSIRPLVVGRKSFQFVGSEKAGTWAATLYSLMESCRLAELDPRAYLREVTKLIHQAKRRNESVDWAALSPARLKRQVQAEIKRRRREDNPQDPYGLEWNQPYRVGIPTDAPICE